MKVKDLITILLDFDMNKEITIEYPNDNGFIVGNYCRYKSTNEFDITEYPYNVLIGIER